MSELQDYIDAEDPNYYWRLSSGEIQNLLDAAIERGDALDKSNELLKQIFKDITSNNKLAPDTFDRLASEIKRYE